MPDFAFEVAPNDAATCKSLVEKYETEGLELTVDIAAKTARCTRETKRARLGYKMEFNYRFGTVERLFEFCYDYLKNLAEFEVYKAERKAKRAAERAAAKENVTVGDIFVASWGWEQTNVDAYQVVAKKGATVTLREIGLKSIEGSEGFMSDRVVPVKDAFIGEEFKKRITGRSIKISDCQTAFPMGDRENFYRSWYA